MDLNTVLSEERREKMEKLLLTMLYLPDEDLAVLQLNANAFKVRRDVEKGKVG